MIATLLDIEDSMMQQAGRGDDSMAIVYDFVAAFPSIEHRLFRQFFRCLEWPEWFLMIIAVL
eukprot:5479869-Pyramimonas_sp.AAC.1